MTSVRLCGLTKVYPTGTIALAAVDLTVASGELLVLLGHSGSGKSTLLRQLAGLEVATAGMILFGEQLVNDTPPHLRGVGFVPQRVVLYPHLTVEDNLRFGLPSGQASSLSLREIAALLGIADLLARYPGQLSGGQQQRVALGRALARNSRLLLLDEPLSGLDGPLRWEFRQQLHLLRRRLSATIILVTHEQDDALALADRIAVLDRGSLLQVGTPQQLLDTPASTAVARMVGWPPINLVPTPLLPKDVSQRLAKPGILGLRPDSVRIGVAAAQTQGQVLLPMRRRAGQPNVACGYGVVEAGPLTLVGRCEGDGDDVLVALDLSRAVLFDAETGRA